MSNIGKAIKTEIVKTVKKEIRSSGTVSTLKNLTRRIAHLERASSSLETLIKRAIETGHKARASHMAGQRGRQFRATPDTLRKLRARLGVTQGEFAKLLGVSGNAAWQWEAGRANPRGKTLKAIQALGKIGKREARRRVEAM